jgi:glycosyltransferase involved in cell wall biosynthesis
MKLAVSGFVSEQAGSVASANALLLRELLLLGHKIHFFSKASFVDPRPAVGNLEGFRFFDVMNTGPDRLRRQLSRVPVAGFLAGLFDSSTYSRLLVSEMTRKHAVERYDLCLWLGEFSRGRTNAVPVVSFIQGPPGTDARSILDRFDEIKALAGSGKAIKWRILALSRLSRVGLPPLALTDHFIVGSQISKRTLNTLYGVRNERIFTLPYPIDVNLFHPNVLQRHGSGEGAKSLRACWLGRVIPRKRLDLFLDGAALAIREGIDVRLTLVGGIGFVPGYEKLIKAFPYPDRLRWKRGVSRDKVPALLGEHDVLVQPSDEENFGSSVAEAQACGLPVIVGRTNGNSDYLCSRDIHLRDDRPETLASALRELSLRKAERRWGDPAESRRCAEQHFSLDKVTKSLVGILQSVIAGRPR